MSLNMKPDEPCAKNGAERLSRTIVNYWARQGHYVSVQVISAGFQHSVRGHRFDVRSDMLNGWPREYALEVLGKKAKRAA